jgi:nucleotidyltransferase substrate binding protein (TIGR01987 family)
MTEPKRNSYTALNDAIARLEEALAEDRSNPLAVDGTIQRFEFTYEFFLKVLKQLLREHEQLDVRHPKQALQSAYKLEWLEGEESQWIDMLCDRNKTSHTYEPDIAEEVYAHVQDYLPLIKTTYSALQNRFGLA